MDIEIDDFFFTSKFDSGNLAKVQLVKVLGQSSCSAETSSDLYQNLRPEFRFHLWTRPDAAGTPYENTNRTWFHFAVQSKRRTCVVQYVMQNLNKQMRLYTQGMAPVYCVKPGSDEYERIPHQPWFWLDGEQFYMSFIHVTPNNSSATTYFAFTYPYSYEKLQRYLGTLDSRFAHCKYLNKESARDQIFYSRELVCRSLERRNIDLLTVTSCHGMTDQTEPHLQCLFPLKELRPPIFQAKRVVFLTARVHPGETPSSYVLQGFLEFILSDTEVLAYKLRKKFVFKIIPMLNPDGVAMGHYRTDSRGVNLNRVYVDPIFEHHPSVFAVKTLILYHHIASRKGACPQSNPPNEKRSAKKSNKSAGANSSTSSIRLEIVGKALTISPEPDSSFAKTENAETKDNATPSFQSASNAGGELGAGASVANGESLLELLGVNFQPEVIRVAMPRDFYEESKVEMNNITEARVPSAEPAESPDDIPPIPPTGMLQTFNDEWSTFVNSVLKIRGELSQTLRELQETFSITVTENVPEVKLLPRVENESPPIPEPENKCEDIASDSAGSEREEESKAPKVAEENEIYGTHLLVPAISTDIHPKESGIVFYVDMHGHASRRGCFMYGNHFDDVEDKMDCMLLPKVLSINCSYFDFSSCVFSRKNMYCQDRKDGTTKLGCGRVAIHNMIRITRSYTLECNYNTGVLSSPYPAKTTSSIMQSTPPQSTYKPQVYEQVGRSLAVTFLDSEDSPRNGSRLSVSDCRSMPGVKEWLRQYIKASENGSRYLSFSTRSGRRASLLLSSTRELFNAARQATSSATIAPANRRHSRRRRPFTARNLPVTNERPIGRVTSYVTRNVQRKMSSPGDGDKKIKNAAKKKIGRRQQTTVAIKKKSSVSASSSDAVTPEKKVKTFCGIKCCAKRKDHANGSSSSRWSGEERKGEALQGIAGKAKRGNKIIKKGKVKALKKKLNTSAV